MQNFPLNHPLNQAIKHPPTNRPTASSSSPSPPMCSWTRPAMRQTSPPASAHWGCIGGALGRGGRGGRGGI